MKFFSQKGFTRAFSLNFATYPNFAVSDTTVLHLVKLSSFRGEPHSFVCPGFGTVIGGILGVLTGAAAGAVAGNTVGKLLDENVFRQYRCPDCGYTWRAA